jgi:cAMP-binding proteins - catabolite gene activator and regulatory subunit of cAMP-dependent protein kinases
MTDKLIEQLKKLYPNIEKNQSELETCSHLRQLQKDEILLDFHSVCRHYYFVNKGALRIFFLEDGQEYTSWFAFENYFFTELESYTNSSFSNYCIVATEETEILEIGKTDMDNLLKKYDWWKDFLLFNQQQTIVKLTEAIKSFQTQSAKERYEDLFNYPDFIQRTKQKDLSTMIGITRHSLSRLRKK